MTIRELYQWAEHNNALDLDIHIQYRDGGGYYNGYDDILYPEVEEKCYGKFVDI